VADPQVPEPVRTAWQAAVDAWDDAARHEAFFAAVAQHRCFAYGAARYRERSGDPTAERQLERLRKSATAAMLATAAARPETAKNPYRATVALFVVLVVLAIAALLYTAVLHSRATSKPSGLPTRQLR
jgi:hypothetical protein